MLSGVVLESGASVYTESQHTTVKPTDAPCTATGRLQTRPARLLVHICAYCIFRNDNG